MRARKLNPTKSAAIVTVTRTIPRCSVVETGKWGRGHKKRTRVFRLGTDNALSILLPKRGRDLSHPCFQNSLAFWRSLYVVKEKALGSSASCHPRQMAFGVDYPGFRGVALRRKPIPKWATPRKGEPTWFQEFQELCVPWLTRGTPEGIVLRATCTRTTHHCWSYMAFC